MGNKSKDLVNIRVTKHLPMGLGVEKENGQHGLIRTREIGGELNQSSGWQEKYPVGWTGEAVPLTTRKGQIQEFSLRLVEKRSMEDTYAIIKKGEIFEGVVTGIVTYGVFVEIAPGVTGLLHRSQLPPWVKASPIELFWPGDRVFVTVQEIKYSERKLTLGFPESTRRIGREDQEHTIHTINNRQAFDHEVDLFLKQKGRKKNIMIVEDDPRQSSAIASWLRHLGQHVDVFSDAEDALASLEKIIPDIAFIDIGLPAMDGLEMSRIINEQLPQIGVVITTDYATAEIFTDRLKEELRNHAELLIKPLLPEDLFSLIKKEEEQPQLSSTGPIDSNLPPVLFEQPKKVRSNKFKRNIIDQLRRYLGFELVILFSLDAEHQQVTILESCGDALLNSAAIPQLIYSPVRDVAAEQIPLFISEIQPHSRDRFRYLLDFYPQLAACMAIPIKSRLPEDFALFAMDKHRQQISPEQKMYIEAAALALAVNLEQDTFNERSILIQRSALIGQVTRGMVHEINNLISPLQTQLEHLQYKLKKMEKGQQPTVPGEPDSVPILNELSDIENNLRKIIATTRMFGRIAAKSRSEILRIDEIINETIHLMRDISSQSHVNISFTPPEHMLISRNQAAALEQVILNVLLNTVQQISELHAGNDGRVHVWLEPPYEEEDRKFFKILIQDNGPGIHMGQWEESSMLALQPTADGSGIGLYISRNLMEDSGGRIYVKESHILSGTIFCLEVPYHL